MDKTTTKPMELADMALLLKTMKSDVKNNLLFLMTGMELQAAMDKSKDESEEK